MLLFFIKKYQLKQDGGGPYICNKTLVCQVKEHIKNCDEFYQKIWIFSSPKKMKKDGRKVFN